MPKGMRQVVFTRAFSWDYLGLYCYQYDHSVLRRPFSLGMDSLKLHILHIANALLWASRG